MRATPGSWTSMETTTARNQAADTPALWVVPLVWTSRLLPRPSTCVCLVRGASTLQLYLNVFSVSTAYLYLSLFLFLIICILYNMKKKKLIRVTMNFEIFQSVKVAYVLKIIYDLIHFAGPQLLTNLLWCLCVNEKLLTSILVTTC